jgi:predicted ATPase
VLSPARQMEFSKLMPRMEQSTICQVIMVTHSPMLMAYPNARACYGCRNTGWSP